MAGCVTCPTTSAARGWPSGRHWPPPPRRLARGRHPGDDRAARHRVRHGLPVLLGAGRRRSGSPTWTGRCTTTAASSSSWPCAAPSSSSRATCCRRCGRARRLGSPAPSGPGWPRTSSGGDRRRRRRVARPRPGRGPRGARGRAGRASRGRGPAGGADDRREGRRVGRRDLVGRRGCSPTSARPPTSCAAPTPAASRRAPRWTLIRHWLDDVPAARGRPPTATGSSSAAGCARSAPAPRTTSSGGSGDQGAWCGRRSPSSTPSRFARSGRHRLAAARRPRRSARPRRVGGAAAGARPDRHGLAGARLLSRPAPRPALRQPRQRRHHRLGRRPGRGLLGPGRGRRRAGAVLERVPARPGAPSTPRRRG